MTLDERVAQLERAVARWRVATLGAMAVLIAAVILGVSSHDPRTIEAERFIVRDAKGIVRAELGLAPFGNEFVAINDPVDIKMNRDDAEKNPTPGLVLRNESGREQVKMFLWRGGSPQFQLKTAEREDAGFQVEPIPEPV